jgi:sterol desaturase/sphingolipid hydroxylase (fatty acid hydroxylase superfamily)
MLIKLAVIVVIGAPALAVLIFEVLLNASSLFNHSNLSLHTAVDGLLRRFIVTPDMHRVHHSVIKRETNSNYGFFLPWWDRLFGTYIAQPERGHQNMDIGLDDYRNSENARLDRMLINPFL